ncbi:heme exporter protein CcmD [Sphingomonas lutea]|uniref:Heme exporter protein D n=1 Tax=Sphingomonas lutea TaxID=1045317 RepID=A0A7G9SFS2_9SPHN|nr:heme exporter protein CcmD [Sphingomonas lutea]QNN66697.1 heme exporter protein CcmD [Sphingomonas lutea]
MNPWPFVTAAYAVTIVSTALLILWSWRAMRRAEAAADTFKSK